MCEYFPAPQTPGTWGQEQMQGAGLYGVSTASHRITMSATSRAPTAETPSLLILDEVETLFHEFGHALQGMLTTAPYKSLAGPNVDRDYVELCSQLYEHWDSLPKCLRNMRATTRPERLFRMT